MGNEFFTPEDFSDDDGLTYSHELDMERFNIVREFAIRLVWAATPEAQAEIIRVLINQVTNECRLADIDPGYALGKMGDTFKAVSNV